MTIDPAYAEEIKEDQLGPGESFKSLAEDSEFKEVLAKALVDAARDYGQAYKKDLRDPGTERTSASTSRKRLLKLLKDAAELNAGVVKEELNPTRSPDSFELLRNDPDFRHLLNELR